MIFNTIKYHVPIKIELEFFIDIIQGVITHFVLTNRFLYLYPHHEV